MACKVEKNYESNAAIAVTNINNHPTLYLKEGVKKEELIGLSLQSQRIL